MATSSLSRNVVRHVMFTTSESVRRPLEESFRVGAELGRGSYGNVFQAARRGSGQLCAVKVISKDKTDKRFNRFVDNELEILKFVQHRHIVALYEILETPDNFYLVTELCDGGELESRVFPEQDVRVIITRLVDVVQYLHANNLVHRDIKPENILLVKSETDPFDIRLGDFGLSCYKGTEDMLLDSCGTPLYMAPEVLRNHAYSDKCDIWSIGVIMYQLLSGVDSLLLHSMLQSDRLDYGRIAGCSQQAQDLLKRMLTLNPANRDSASEIMHDPWITGKSCNGVTRMNVLELMEQMNTESSTPVKPETDMPPLPKPPALSPKQSSFLSKSHNTSRPLQANVPLRKTSHNVRMRTLTSSVDKSDPRRLTNPDCLSRPITSLSPARQGVPSYMQDTKASRIARQADPRALKRNSVVN